MNYEFMSEEDAFGYLDAMHEDGFIYGALIEDHLNPGEFRLAHELAGEFEATWNEVIMLPEVVS